MLEVVNALEVEVVGVFKDIVSASRFNKKVGNKLRLYPVRTTLPYEQFTKEIFLPGMDGAFLEDCVGKGNVHLRVTKSTFPAVRARVGSFSERDQLQRKSFIREEVRFNGIYKTTGLLAKQEIQKLAMNPFKIIHIQHFGLVNQRNIEEFLCDFDEAYKHFIENEEPKYVAN